MFRHFGKLKQLQCCKAGYKQPLLGFIVKPQIHKTVMEKYRQNLLCTQVYGVTTFTMCVLLHDLYKIGAESLRSPNSSQEGATKLKLVSFCSSRHALSDSMLFGQTQTLPFLAENHGL